MRIIFVGKLPMKKSGQPSDWSEDNIKMYNIKNLQFLEGNQSRPIPSMN
jgi:hypothetical protein